MTPIEIEPQPTRASSREANKIRISRDRGRKQTTLFTKGAFWDVRGLTLEEIKEFIDSLELTK